jgi:hypothetical protein
MKTYKLKSKIIEKNIKKIKEKKEIFLFIFFFYTKLSFFSRKL